jgi:hypothetical protein
VKYDVVVRVGWFKIAVRILRVYCGVQGWCVPGGVENRRGFGG